MNGALGSRYADGQMATEVIPYPQVTAAAAAQYTQLTPVPANRYVAELHIQPAPGNYMSIHVVDWATKIILKSLYPPPAPTVNGVSDSWTITSGDCADGLDPTQYAVLLDHANDKWNAYAVVR